MFLSEVYSLELKSYTMLEITAKSNKTAIKWRRKKKLSVFSSSLSLLYREQKQQMHNPALTLFLWWIQTLRRPNSQTQAIFWLQICTRNNILLAQRCWSISMWRQAGCTFLQPAPAQSSGTASALCMSSYFCTAMVEAHLDEFSPVQEGKPSWKCKFKHNWKWNRDVQAKGNTGWTKRISYYSQSSPQSKLYNIS